VVLDVLPLAIPLPLPPLIPVVAVGSPPLQLPPLDLPLALPVKPRE